MRESQAERKIKTTYTKKLLLLFPVYDFRKRSLKWVNLVLQPARKHESDISLRNRIAPQPGPELVADMQMSDK